jgi:hypothetical protein
MTLGLAALVLAPLMVGLTFNYWKWPREGARSMGTTCWHFLFRNPA